MVSYVCENIHLIKDLELAYFSNTFASLQQLFVFVHLCLFMYQTYFFNLTLERIWQIFQFHFSQKYCRNDHYIYSTPRYFKWIGIYISITTLNFDSVYNSTGWLSKKLQGSCRCLILKMNSSYSRLVLQTDDREMH